MAASNLLKENTKALYLKYLLPSISATLVTSVYVLADTIILGKGVGAPAIAALNIILPLYSLLFGTGLLFGVGGGVLMSVAKGSQNQTQANSYFTLSILCGLIFSVIYTILGIVYCDPLIYALGGSEQNFKLIKDYLFYLIAFGIVFVFSSLLQSFVRNDNDPKRAMIAVIAGGITNIILDYVFVFLFHMSMAGGAAATVIGTILTNCILLSHFLSKKNTMKIEKKALSVFSALKIFHCGLSSFFIEITSGILMLFFNLQLLRYIGETGVIVYGIISNCAIVAMSLFNGVSQASQPLIAINFGAGEKKRVQSFQRFGMLFAGGIGIILFGFGFFIPKQLISIFVVATDEINLLGIEAIRIYFIGFLFMGFNIFLCTYFQSIVKPIYSLLLCFLRGFFISTIFIFLFPLLLGPQTIWFAMPVTEFIVAIIALYILKIAK